MTFPANPTSNMHGGLDSPADESELRGDVLTVAGWCLMDETAVSHVDVLINGVEIGRARTFLERPDIAAVYPHRDAPVAGFQMLVPLEEWSPKAPLEVSVIATGLDGRRWYSKSSRLRRVVDEASRATSDPRQLDEQRKLMLAKRGAPRETPKVVVVTHDLGYGGAQLWLSEALRQFRELDHFTFDIISFMDGPLRQPLEEAGAFVHVTPPPAINGLAAHDGRVTEFAVLFRALEADAVMVNTIVPFQAVEAAHLLGLPVVWVVHESYGLSVFCHTLWGDAVDSRVRDRFAEAFGLAEALVFQAEQTADLFSHLSLASRRHVLDHGVDIAEIDEYRRNFDRAGARAQHGWTDHDIVFAVVGTFDGRKAQAAVVAAFDEVLSVHEEAHLVMVGVQGGPFGDAVAEQVRRLDSPHRVTLVPLTPDTYYWHAIADVAVCASDIESLPRSILEAMASGQPVVSTDVFGLATLIDDGVTGWLTRCSDLQGLVATMDRALRLQPAERRTVAIAARQEVERRSSSSYGLALANALSALMVDRNVNLQPILSR
ncbi:MAG: glycosyltransferase family 4 protein [Actinomycetia bacterium]|nr:glycosyltransferase family 4 protein [Actinomycetes bacterium]